MVGGDSDQHHHSYLATGLTFIDTFEQKDNSFVCLKQTNVLSFLLKVSMKVSPVAMS